MTNRIVFAGAMLATGLAAVPAARAQELPSLLCATNAVMECTRMAGCLEIPAAMADVPPFVQVDLANETVMDPRNPDDQRSVIDTIHAIDGKIIIHGTDPGVEDARDGIGWTATISEQTGEMVTSAAGEGVAFVIYGACMVQ